MNRALTGEAYHEYMRASKRDQEIRRAFQNVFLSLAPQGASILDFGAGTGLDIKFYANRGYGIHAYDASHEMRDYLVRHCRDEIDSGRVHVIHMDYEAFVAPPDLWQRSLDAVTANFAVLNLIPDHAPLFRAFDRWLAPKGFVLASVINPYHFRDARHRWWWRNLGALLRAGRYSIGAGGGVTYRYSLSSLRGGARPYFVLDRIFPSAPTASTTASDVIGTGAIASLSRYPFLFLLFRRP